MKSIDLSAMNKVSYGVYVLTTRSGEKDNGCVVNVVAQLTEQPLTMAVAVNKMNLTHDMIMSSGVFNVNILTENASMDVIRHFGFQSGRNVEKFVPESTILRASNGVPYIHQQSNSFISGRVSQTVDLGSHTLFIAEITESVKLNDEPSMTYNYYHTHVKNKAKLEEKKSGRWVCQVCGYVYDGDELPEDFICPWCKHGAYDFKKE